MLDFSHLAKPTNSEAQYFVGGAAADGPTGTGAYTWNKPRGAKWVFIMAAGAGASGGCGINTSTASGGGAGGPSGALTTLLIPAIFIPEVLFIRCGLGGASQSTTGATPVAGGATYVSCVPESAAPSTYSIPIVCYAPGGSGGGTAASNTAGAVAPGGGALASAVNMVYGAGKGFFNAQSSVAGANGGAISGAGTSAAYTTGTILMPGAGGGGCSGSVGQLGGAITNTLTDLSSPQYLYPSTPAQSLTVNTVGASGVSHNYFIRNTGGQGGNGANGAASGGAGGDGAPGCGGGGSGGQTTTFPTINRSGAGGPGFVYIVAW